MDQRYHTFLTLCKWMNYRKTAEALNLTQPAVTRQIQSLEAEFEAKLFLYDRHKLTRTPESEVLENYIISLRHNYEKLEADLSRAAKRTMRVGATKTIGDYVICDWVERYLTDSSHHLSLVIDNTEALLERLRSSELDFAIVEGIFDKSRYAHRFLSREPFTGICAADHPLAGRTVSLRDLFGETMIVREKGSGTRDILERELMGQGYSLNAFSRCAEISSFQLINRLIAAGRGISFVYEAVVRERPDIAAFTVEEFETSHEFHIVWLKHTELSDMANEFLQPL